MDADDAAVFSTDAILERLGKNIAEHRQRAGLTQHSLADRAGVSRAFLAKVEVGERNSSVILLAKLGRAMGVSVSELMRGL